MKVDDLAQRERAKYLKMWAQPSYRENSPGRNVAPFALEKLGATSGDRLWDFGCGEGRALDFFRENGIRANGIDIVSMRKDIVQACLWDLPGSIAAFEFVFCADVLEHIPPEKVDAVLEAIRSHAIEAAFVTVATVECTQGKRYGEELHLTVQPIEWWRQKFERVWSHVEIGQGDRPWRFWAYLRP